MLGFGSVTLAAALFSGFPLPFWEVGDQEKGIAEVWLLRSLSRSLHASLQLRDTQTWRVWRAGGRKEERREQETVSGWSVSFVPSVSDFPFTNPRLSKQTKKTFCENDSGTLFRESEGLRKERLGRYLPVFAYTPGDVFRCTCLKT